MVLKVLKPLFLFICIAECVRLIILSVIKNGFSDLCRHQGACYLLVNHFLMLIVSVFTSLWLLAVSLLTSASRLPDDVNESTVTALVAAAA